MQNTVYKRIISVLHIVLTTGTGGMENVVYNLGVSMDPTKIKIKVGYLLWRGHLSDKLAEKSIESEKIPKGFPIISMMYPRQIIRYIIKSGCQIVHVHSGCWFKVAAACAHLPNIKLIYTDHGRTFPENKLQILMDKFSIRYTSQVVAVSKILQKYLIDKVGLPEDKVMHINNCIDTERFKPSNERDIIRRELGFSNKEFLIGIVARLAPVKNHRYLINAFRIVSEKYSHARLLIIGDGPLRKELEILTTSYQLDSKIKFLGDRQDVPYLLQSIDISTLSSLSEGISLTILEAMSTGLPVVATAVGGNVDLIKNGENGFLVDLNNISEFADKLSLLVRSSELRKHMGQKGREEVISNWSLRLMNKKYEDLYEQLLQ